MRKKLFPLVVVATGLFSFALKEIKPFEFAYPKRNGTTIVLSADHFKKFSKEWRGSDYYYYAEGDGFICSVLYYKLNDNDKIQLIDPFKAAMNTDKSPAYPYTYFKNYSQLKDMERNDSTWGSPTDDFMFRQNDIVIDGTNFSQKHMYGYAMVDKDLFVNIHLSKTGCSSSDSTELMNILKSLTVKKQ